MRLAAVLLAALLLAGCQIQPAPRPSTSSRPSPSPTPLLVLRAPAEAILTEADVKRPQVSATDALTAAELAASAPDQVVALREFSGWGWVAGARRHWSGGGVSVDDLVLLTARAEGARGAFAYFAAQAAHAPLAARPCPASIAGLDDCTWGSSGNRDVVAGRLAEEVFVLELAGADAPALAAAQAARMRAT